MTSQLFSSCAASILFLCAAASLLFGQAAAQDEKSQNPMPPSSKVAASNPASYAKQPSPGEELQQAISKAGNDRAALVRHLEAFWKLACNCGTTREPRATPNESSLSALTTSP